MVGETVSHDQNLEKPDEGEMGVAFKARYCQLGRFTGLWV